MNEARIRAIKLSVVAILLIVAGISIGVIIKSNLDEQASQRKQQELQSLWTSSSTEQVSEVAATESQQSYAHPKFEELMGINKDLVGWLEVGELSAPVVQTDNNDYYLTHDFYGKEDKHGTVFADTRNDIDGSDDNLVLYGHNYNKSKQIFYEVEKYKDPAYAIKHPVFSFTTLNEKRDYLVVGVYFTNTVPEQGDVFDYHNKLVFNSNSEMEQFITDIRSRSLITTDAAADSYDQLITLSTCGYDFEGQRIVLMGRRLRPNETAQQLAKTTYSVNPAPIMPEIWTKLYGKRG